MPLTELTYNNSNQNSLDIRKTTFIYGCKQDVCIRIMDLDDISCNKPHPPLLGLQVNSIHWSPTDGLIVLSRYGNFVLYDVIK